MATWRAYLAVGLAAVIVAALLPVVPAFWLAQVVTLSALPMVIHRVRKAGGRTPWTLLALSTAFFCGATVVRAVHSSMTGDPFPFPSPADGLYYCGYLFLLGVAIGIHRQRRDPRATSADLLDALIVASGVGMVVWGFVMSPYSRNGDLPTFERLLNGGYSFFDLALIAVVARIAVATNARNGAYRLLAGCFAMVVVTDVLATMATVSSAFAALAGLASVLCFLFAGAAALHGDAGTLLTRVEPKRATLSRRRLGLLVLALAMGPLVLLVRDLAGHPVDTVTVVGGSSLLCSLVLARMALLVKENERRAAAERMLRSAEEALVTATSRDDMLAAALAAALALVGDGPDTSVALADQHADGLAVAASTGGGARSPANEHANVLTIPLVSQNEVRGALIVTTKDPVRYDVAESLGDLAAVVALALESAARIAELHRQRSERRFRALIENSSDIVAILDSAGRFSFISGAVETMLGYSVEDLLCTSPLRLVHGTDKKRAIASLRGVRTAALTDTSGTIRVRHRDGSWRQMEITAQDLSHDSDVEGLVLNCRDVTERNRLETELRHQALHDALTGLANRVLFSDRVDHAVAKRGTAATGVAVLFVDLDDFKTVNDSLGHVAGDELLIAVAARLRECVRVGDTAARLGGDEFAILLDDAGSDAEVRIVADRVLDALRLPFNLEGRDVNVTASIGIALDADRTASADVLLRNADAAMYLAKERGKDRFVVFEEQMHHLAFQRLELKADLARGIENDEFLLVYQPIIDLATGRAESVEALVRWEHPSRGMVAPDAFIPLAEETGLIVPLGLWILRTACHQFAAWRSELGAEAPKAVSVNVSVRQLERESFVDDVRATLAEAGIEPSELTLEITESILMADTNMTKDRLASLKELGVAVAVDDFGSGYSSLGYLQRFPVDILKVDRSFIEGLVTATNDGNVMRAIVDLAAVLGLSVVAEGIELTTQLDRVRELGCSYGQGYLFSRPVAPAAIIDFARQPHTPAVPAA